MKLRGLDIARAARSKAKQSRERLTQTYGKLLNSTSRVVGQAKRFSKEIAAGVKRASSIRKQLVLEGLDQELDAIAMVPQQPGMADRMRGAHQCDQAAAWA